MDTATPGDITRRIDALWDELAGFDAARHDEALTHLLRALCELVDGRNANWIGAVRLPDMAPGDPLRGWRPRFVCFLHPAEALDVSIKKQTARLERPGIDISVVRNVALAGHWRVNRLVDLNPPEWFESNYYRDFYLGFDNIDAIWAGCPVNADTEVYFGLFRQSGQPRFTRTDCDTVFAALRGLRWFHRQYMLSRGLLVADAPLTPVEREVLQGLLGGLSEKEMAQEQNRAVHTIHGYVKALYRKFGVKNRGSLMALWLGKLS